MREYDAAFEWKTMIDGNELNADAERLQRAGKIITDWDVRDRFLLSVLDADFNPAASKDEVVQAIRSVLPRVFDDPDAMPDYGRIDRACDLLQGIAAEARRSAHGSVAAVATPAALTAYLRWLEEDVHEADRFATLAQEADPSLVMSALVRRVLDLDVNPRWVERHPDALAGYRQGALSAD